MRNLSRWQTSSPSRPRRLLPWSSDQSPMFFVRAKTRAVMMLAGPMAMAVTMTVTMAFTVAVAMGVMRQRLPRGHVVENQRLHGNGHGVRGKANPAQVDVVEIDEHDAVDHQQFRLDTEILAQHPTQGLRQVAVENQVERLFARDLS